MRRIIFSISLVLGCLGAPALSMADDHAIAEQIVTQLNREKEVGNLRGFNLDMNVADGAVWLEGKVANEQQQTLVLDIARRVPGVTRVMNAIDIRSEQAHEALQYPRPIPQPINVPQQERQEVQTPSSDHVAAARPNQSLAAQRQGEIQANTIAYPNVVPRESTSEPEPTPARVPATAPAPEPMSRLLEPNPAQTPTPLQSVQVQPNARYANPAYRTPTEANPLPIEALPQGNAAQYSGQPVPMGAGAAPGYIPGTSQGVRPATYDHPSMPGHAWPSYAAHPNYAAVTYPNQYSPAAWPYIGPFYPYPQVPLGWRKVTLEWDDGWWFLDFQDR